MANQDANVIKLVGGATETAVDLAARMIEKQLAQCPFEGVLVFKDSASSYTTYPDTDEVQALITQFGGIEEAPVDGETYARKDGTWYSISSPDYTDYNPLVTPPSYEEGRIWYDALEKKPRFFSDNQNFTSWVNGALTLLGTNETGVEIAAGKAVDVHELNTALNGFQIRLADSLEMANNNNEGWVVAVAVDTIPDGEAGTIAIFGTLSNVDTSGLIAGQPAYVGTAGALTSVRPNYPAKAVLVGSAIFSNATTGVLGIKIAEENYDYEFDGCIVEKCGYNIVVDGTAVYIDVYNLDSSGVEDTTRNLPVQLGGQILQLNTTTGAGVSGRARKVLTQGTVTAPQYQTVYIKNVGGIATLDVSLTTPPVPYAIVGQVAIRRYQDVTSYGADVNRRITSSKAHNSRGRISYLTERWSVESPKWFSGVTPTASITTNVMNLAVIAGEVYQTHKQSFPALNVVSDGVFIANGGGGVGLSNYTRYTSLTDVLGYTSANLAEDTSCTGNLVIYGVINKETSECKLCVNLPTLVGGTNATAGRSAYYDTDSNSVLTAPTESRFVAFLICRIPYHWNGGTASFLDPTGATTTSGEHVINLLGTPLGVSGGASGNASAPTPPLTDVLIAGNDGGGEQVKNIADGTADQDAVTVAQLEAKPLTALTPLNSWTVDTANRALSVIDKSDGSFELQGVISAGTKTDGTVIFSVGAGRADATKAIVLTAGTLAGTTYEKSILLNIAVGGNVLIYGDGTADKIYLDGVRWTI